MIESLQLNLLKNKLKDISESPYFSHALADYLLKLSSITDKLIKGDHLPFPDDTSRNIFILQIFRSTKFFTGSTSNNIPYEIVFCLEQACKEWVNQDALITTAISPDITDFYISYVPYNFYHITKYYFDVEFNHILIQISLPQFYRRRPLYVTPLFHELGHFVDYYHRITDFTLFEYGNDIALPGFDRAMINNDHLFSLIQKNHRAEYFADLFSSSYIGASGIDFLNEIAPNAPTSQTHPSTKDRINFISDFLNNRPNSIVDMFNDCLALQSNRKISPVYFSPNINKSFDNVRPYKINNHKELYSFINSAWSYLKSAWKFPENNWSYLSQTQIEKSVNDLVEKSLRNYMVEIRWKNNEAS